ncbi:VOC family protein [Sorangium sp. So ce388]|uniref:VOC family protein n=1 Tax=Sorangium sp. So ce388 TaxID=3133309 RepID=UPI003F5BF367
MNLQSRMKLNHLSFPTVDVTTEAKFFEEHFGARIEFVDTATGNALLKHGGTDIVLEAMKEAVPWHRDFHFGFELETKREVDALYEQLKRAGVKVETEVFNRVGRGSRFFGRTPGGVQFEINTREDMESKWDADKK